MNIAEILKDCPKGTKLYSPIFGNVEFIEIKNNLIFVKAKENFIATFIRNGKYRDGYNDAECLLFPSKENRDWSKFQRPFKDGDIIFTHANCLRVGLGNTWISIFRENRNGGVATYVDFSEDGDYYDDIDGSKGLLCMYEDILRQRLATPEEKQNLFDAIKANGYKWNAETKTLEKLIVPKFKVGDRIKHVVGREETATIKEVKELYYNLDSKVGTCSFTISSQDEWELVPNKFDITTLKPFDKVFVRDEVTHEWIISLFGYVDQVETYIYSCIDGTCYAQCIPYNENTKHLLGTTDDCDEYYKTW